MNQIYKVIWSRVKHCYVVVSEVAGRCGKNGGAASEKESLPIRAFLCALALTGCLMPGVAEANTQYGPGASATGGDSVAVGDSAKATAGHATAIGTLTEADGTNSFVAGLQAKSGATAENSVAIGRGAQALGQKRVSEQFTASTIAIGNNATATENGDIVIGRQAKSTVSQYHNHPQGGNGAVVMGAEAASYGSRGDVVLGAGAEACLLRKDVTNPADKSEYSQGVAIGSRAKVYGTQSTSIGADSRSIGHSSIAIGGDDIDKAKPVLTAAIPDMATTGVQKNFNRELAVLYPGTTLGSAAINDSKNYVNTASIGNASMAIGMMTQSYGTGSTAIGVNTLTKGIASTGIGVMARSWGDKSLALGSRAETYGNKSTAVGDANTVGFDMTDGTTSGAASSAVGTDNKVYGNNSYAIGGGNTIGSATITETTEANGDKIKKVTAGTVKGSTAGAFGYKNTVTTDNAYVVGNNSTASADGAMVLGSSASVTGKNGVALGNNTKVANENAVAIGNGSETAAAVATPSATINGVAHNFAGVNPASTVSVGKAGAERTITNVAAGRISATSTDAINGSQLYAVTSEIDKGVAYAGDVKAAAAAANKFTRKLGEQTNIIGGVTDTSKLTDGNIGVVSNGTDTLNIKLAKDVKVDSVTTGNTVINNNGLTVGGKTYVTNNGINANNQKVTNVADGQVAAGSKDAVNGGQLHDAKNEVINKGLRFDADNNSEKTNKLGSKVTVNGDNNITTEITQTGDDTKIGVKLNKDIHVKTVTATDTVKAGGVTMGGQTVANAAGANESGNYVTGLDNKTWNIQNPNIVSGRGATEDQLKVVSDEVKKQGANATDYRLVKNASNADGSYAVDSNGNIDLTVEDKNHAGQKETVKLKDIASKSKLDDVINKGLQFDANVGGVQTNKLGSKITIKGEGTGSDNDYSGENLKTFITQDPAGNTTIDVKMNKNLKVETIVATGENGKDGKIGINGKDGQTTNISVTRDGKPGVDGAPGTTTTRIVYQKPDGTNEEVATLNDGMKYGGDTGNVIKKKLNEQVNVVGGITDTNKLTTEDNLGVVSDGNNNLKVRMAKDLKGLNSVTTNTLTVGDVKIDNSGINAGNKKITNVAAGDISANSTDAVNGGQLWKTNQTINNIGGAVNELGDRMDRVGAGAAALAALHPLDFDPDDKWDVAAGYGNYKDAHAVAVGAFYRPNEDTMFSVGGSFGGGENMVNAGVSVKLGQGNHVSTSRVALAKEVEDLKAIVKAQSAEIKAMRGAMQSGASVMKDVNFPDVPKDHWAYSYVKSLADRGLLEGYPDGEFKGDRSMTRYEFAAIIYRALQNGAPIDSDMAKAIGEFDPEINRIKDLDRIRVDRISGKDNDRHKVERVRVNNESNKEKGDYRDVYGSHISPKA